jgi:hypothetical protein
MDLFFVIVIVVAILFGLTQTSFENEIGHSGKDRWGWKFGIIGLAIGLFGLWYSLTQFEQQVAKSYKITDTFTINGGSVMKFSKPVGIKTRHTDYAWCVFRQETNFEIDVDKGCQ